MPGVSTQATVATSLYCTTQLLTQLHVKKTCQSRGCQQNALLILLGAERRSDQKTLYPVLHYSSSKLLLRFSGCQLFVPGSPYIRTDLCFYRVWMLHLSDSNYREFIADFLVCHGKAGPKASYCDK